MVKKKILTHMSVALLLCGSLSSLQAIGGSFDVGGVSHDVSTDWVDVQHNRYFDEHYSYDKNQKVAHYPYAHDTKIKPAYVDDNYQSYGTDRVHGHPVSIQFNPDKSGNIVVNSFVLKNSKGEIVATKTATKELNDRQFAIVPTHRLDWDEEYTVAFSYKEDGTPKKETWAFRTEALEHPLYTLENRSDTHDIARNSTYAFYATHRNHDDVAGFFHHSGEFKVEKAVDHDTYYVGVEAAVGSDVTATINDEEYKFHIFTDEIEKLEFTSVDDTSVTLKWYHTRSGEEKGYKIYRDGKFLASVSADTEVYRDNHVRAGATYTYTVKVTNDKI